MKQYPRFTVFLAAMFALIAVSLPLQVAAAYHYSLNEVVGIFAKLSGLNLLLMGLSLVNAVGVLRMAPFLKVTIPLQLFVVAWNNTVAGYAGLNTSMGAAQLATLAFAAFCSVFLFEPFRTLLSKPESRWWLTPARTKFQLPVFISGPLGLNFHAQTYDLSLDGVFLRLDAISLNQLSRILAPGTVLDMRVKLNQLQILPLQGMIVRLSPERGHYPAGIGIKFVHLTSYQRRVLGGVLDQRIPLVEAA